MTDDAQLLQDYANGSETAFRELVTRYVNLVYSAAIRHLPSPLAEDVVQTVFTVLARKAPTLPKNVVLGGWLYRHTCFVAAQALRTERRRQARERQAVEMNALNGSNEPDWKRLAPFLDEAMQHLASPDRDAVVLRYFERRELRNVGAALGVSEEAARKRVTRALEKLRAFFAGRGVTLSAATLATLLAGHAVSAAPSGLALAASGAALTAAATGTGYTLTVLKIMAMTKLKIGIVSTIIVAAGVTPFILHHVTQVRLREVDASLRAQSAQQASLQAENERLKSVSAVAEQAKLQSDDLQRLQGEVGALRRQTNNLGKLQSDNRRLRAVANLPTVEPTEAQQQELLAKMTYGKGRFIASAMYARNNQGRLPSSFNDLAPGSPGGANPETDPAGDAFELVYSGTFKSMTSLTNAADVVVVRQKEPSAYGNRWAKVYGYGDGHFELHTQADRDFETWEREHLVSPPSGKQ